MTQDRSTPNQGERKTLYQKVTASSYYGLLGVPPSASVREIRQAYRDLSKLYHPDTTSLPAAIALRKFQDLNEAYATLSSPERRIVYDQKIGYSRVPVIQPLPNLNQSNSQSRVTESSSAYLEPTDRPLSPGELFALFILGLTFLTCLVLAITIGLTRGDTVLQPVAAHPIPLQQAATSIRTDSPKPTTHKPDSVSLVAPLATRTAAPVSEAPLIQPSPNSVDSSERSHVTSSP
ncbi:MAG: J domain-containing protein [Kovacikia sp.]